MARVAGHCCKPRAVTIPGCRSFCIPRRRRSGRRKATGDWRLTPPCSSRLMAVCCCNALRPIFLHRALSPWLVVPPETPSISGADAAAGVAAAGPIRPMSAPWLLSYCGCMMNAEFRGDDASHRFANLRVLTANWTSALPVQAFGKREISYFFFRCSKTRIVADGW